MTYAELKIILNKMTEGQLEKNVMVMDYFFEDAQDTIGFTHHEDDPVGSEQFYFVTE